MDYDDDVLRRLLEPEAALLRDMRAAAQQDPAFAEAHRPHLLVGGIAHGRLFAGLRGAGIVVPRRLCGLVLRRWPFSVTYRPREEFEGVTIWVVWRPRWTRPRAVASDLRFGVPELARRAGLIDPLAPACRKDLLAATEQRICELAGRAGRNGRLSILGAMLVGKADAPAYLSPVGAEAWHFLRATNRALFAKAKEALRRRRPPAGEPGGILIPDGVVRRFVAFHATSKPAESSATVKLQLFKDPP